MSIAEIKTADLCDQYPNEVIILPWSVRPFGAKQSMLGEIVTLQVDACNQGIIDYLEQPGNNKILVVENIGYEPNAITGDRLAKLAIDNGWQGLVIRGNIRDSDIIKSLPIGVWALGTCPMRGKSGRAYKQNVEIIIGSQPIVSGYWLYADSTASLLRKSRFNN